VASGSGEVCDRVGDYRLIGNIQDGALDNLVIEVGNRREVYR